MATFLLLAVAVLVLFVTLFWHIWFWCAHSPHQVFKRMGVPGPNPLPLLGNYLALLRKSDVVMCREWQKKYGHVFGMYCGLRAFLMVCDTNVAQEIFKKKFICFDERGEFSLLNTTLTGLPLGIFECSYNKWKHPRHVCRPVFTTMNLKKYNIPAQIIKSSNELLTMMKEESGTINVSKYYRDFALEVAMKTVFGQRADLQSEEYRNFTKAIILSSDAIQGRLGHGKFLVYTPTQYTISSLFPWLAPLLKWLAPGRYLPQLYRVRKAVQGLICKRKANKLSSDCVLDLMIAAHIRGEASLSEAEMISHCLNFVHAAHDTTSAALASCSYALATNPTVQDKLCGLLDKYWLENDKASLADVAWELPYLDMVIDESLRMYTVVPRIVRLCTRSTEVCGLKVPEGTYILISADCLHHQREIWGDPEVFRPERFEKHDQPPGCFIPFGDGPRNCIGFKLARLQLKVALSALLRENKFIPTSATKPLLMTCLSITACPDSDVLLSLQTRLP